MARRQNLFHVYSEKEIEVKCEIGKQEKRIV